MHIVLMGGPDVRFLGGSARARNARVARRAGASVGPLPPASSVAPSDLVVLVPPTVALMTRLFAADAMLAVDATTPVRLIAPDDGWVVVASAISDDALRGSAEAIPTRPIPGGLILNLDTPAHRRAATAAALRATQKATDGWVSRHLNRPISRACSRVALSVGMSATAASLLTLMVGLACAWFAAQPGYASLVATGVLFHLASVLDGVDGEIARATLTESASGARLDTLVDQATYLACFGGLTIGWVRGGSGMTALAFTVLIGLALIVSLQRAGRFVAAHGTNASFVLIDRAVRRAARDTGRFPLRVAAGAFTLLRRDLFAVIFLGVSLTGVRALVPLLILAGIVVANVTLSLYAGELATAARLEVAG